MSELNTISEWIASPLVRNHVRATATVEPPNADPHWSARKNVLLGSLEIQLPGVDAPSAGSVVIEK